MIGASRAMLMGTAGIAGGGGGPVPSPTPTMDDFVGYASGTNLTTHPVSTAGLSWAGAQRIVAVFGASGTVTVTIAGATDDTVSLLNTKAAADSPLYEYELNVIGGALDATINFNPSLSRFAAAFLITLGGVASFQSGTKASGASVGAPVSPTCAVTGGPKNLLVIRTANSRGGHDTNPPLAPSGHTLGERRNAGSTEASTTQNTAAWAYRTYAIADLTWTGGNATVPTATWLGWTDIGAGPWQAGTLVCLPT